MDAAALILGVQLLTLAFLLPIFAIGKEADDQ